MPWWGRPVFVFHGTGSPEGVVSAPLGSRAVREDGGVAYFKGPGAPDTGWIIASETSGNSITPGMSPSVVVKTGDQTFNSATPANVTALSFAVTSGRHYRFQFILAVRSDTLTVGVAASVTTPTITTLACTVRAILAADGAGAEWQGAVTASDDAVIPTAVPAINTDYLMTIEGLLVPSADGTLQVRARTETGTTVVTVRRGSVGYLWDHGT